MKVLIQRRGSGWGGLYGALLVDFNTGIMYNDSSAATCDIRDSLKKLESTDGKQLDLPVDLLTTLRNDIEIEHKRFGLPLKEVDESTISNMLDKLEKLKDAEIKDAGYVQMDQQIDIVYIIYDGKAKLVYSTYFGLTSPTDVELTNNIGEMIELLWSTSKKYTIA